MIGVDLLSRCKIHPLLKLWQNLCMKESFQYDSIKALIDVIDGIANCLIAKLPKLQGPLQNKIPLLLPQSTTQKLLRLKGSFESDVSLFTKNPLLWRIFTYFLESFLLIIRLT